MQKGLFFERPVSSRRRRQVLVQSWARGLSPGAAEWLARVSGTPGPAKRPRCFVLRLPDPCVQVRLGLMEQLRTARPAPDDPPTSAHLPTGGPMRTGTSSKGSPGQGRRDVASLPTSPIRSSRSAMAGPTLNGPDSLPRGTSSVCSASLKPCPTLR